MTETALVTRRCIDDDFAGVVSLLRQLWTARKLNVDALYAVWVRALASDAQIFLCATDGDRIVGFVSLTLMNSLWQEGFFAHLDELVVDDAFRGRGVGGRLLEMAIELASGRGCRLIELETAAHRQEAHLFYERRGFEPRDALGYTKVIGSVRGSE